MIGQRKTRDGCLPDVEGKPVKRHRKKYALVTAMLSSAVPLFLGYNLAVVYSTAVTAEANLKVLACTVAVSSLLGAITGVAAQRLIGDRHSVLLSSAVLSSGALTRGLAAGFTAFTAGVFVGGVGVGLALMVVPAYTAELSPSSARGVLAAHPDGFVYLGCILGSLCYSLGFSKLPPRLAWRLTVAIGTAIPALLSSMVLLMPETPRWLMARDRVRKARRVLSRTSSTLEEAELRLLEIKAELGEQDDESSDEREPMAMATTGSRWRDELAMWRELVARPTEPLRRAVITALAAKVFQQATGIGSMFQYAQSAFRDVGVSSSAQMPRAMAAFAFVVVMSFPVSLVLVELGWLLVTRLAGVCRRRISRRASSPTSSRRGGGGGGMTTRRQEQLKWERGLAATTLLSLMALVWIALGPAQWADASPRGCPRWLRGAASAVNKAVSSGILSSFASVYKVTAGYSNLIVCHSVVVLVLLFSCGRLLGAKARDEF